MCELPRQCDRSGDLKETPRNSTDLIQEIQYQPTLCGCQPLRFGGISKLTFCGRVGSHFGFLLNIELEGHDLWQATG